MKDKKSNAERKQRTDPANKITSKDRHQSHSPKTIAGIIDSHQKDQVDLRCTRMFVATSRTDLPRPIPLLQHEAHPPQNQVNPRTPLSMTDPPACLSNWRPWSGMSVRNLLLDESRRLPREPFVASQIAAISSKRVFQGSGHMIEKQTPSGMSVLAFRPSR